MAKQVINRGTTAGDGTGESLFAAFGKAKSNFDELYDRVIISASDPTVNDDSGDGYGIGAIWFSTGSKRFFLLRDATAGAAVWSELAPTMARLAGHYYGCRRGAGPVASGALVANTLYASLFILERRITFDALAMRCTTGVASTSVLAGIYSHSDANGPDQLLVQPAAAGSAATSNSDVIMTTSANFTLEPGCYWWGSLPEGASGFQAMSNTDPLTQMILGANSASRALAASGNNNGGVSVSRSYGLGLPSTFPSWTRNYTQPIPSGCLRAA